MAQASKLSRWIDSQGGVAAVAKKLKVTRQAVYIWRSGLGAPKHKTVERIVKLAKGKLTLQGVIKEARANL